MENPPHQQKPEPRNQKPGGPFSNPTPIHQRPPSHQFDQTNRRHKSHRRQNRNRQRVPFQSLLPIPRRKRRHSPRPATHRTRQSTCRAKPAGENRHRPPKRLHRENHHAKRNHAENHATNHPLVRHQRRLDFTFHLVRNLTREPFHGNSNLPCRRGFDSSSIE